MEIKTDSGKVIDVRAIVSMPRKRILIEVEGDENSISRIAEEFSGIKTIKRPLTDDWSVYEMYEGYTKLMSVSFTDDETVRIVLGNEKNNSM